MFLDIGRLTKGPILAGSHAGRQLFEQLWNASRDDSLPQIVFIDFSNIDVATSSFLRDSIVAFRRRLREERPNLYAVLINLKPEIEEELAGLLHQMGEAIWVANFSEDGFSDRRLVGRLDHKLREAIELIETRGHADASALWADTRMTESVGVTAWNNRLAALSRQGLVIEDRRGKQKTYSILHFREA